MKIQVIKKANVQVKAYGACPFLVDIPPDGADLRKPAKKE